MLHSYKLQQNFDKMPAKSVVDVLPHYQAIRNTAENQQSERHFFRISAVWSNEDRETAGKYSAFG